MHSMKYQPKELVITKFSRGAESLETVLKNRGGKKNTKWHIWVGTLFVKNFFTTFLGASIIYKT